MSPVLRPATKNVTQEEKVKTPPAFVLPTNSDTLTHDHVKTIATHVASEKLQDTVDETRKLAVMIELSNRKIEKLEKELEYAKRMLEAQILEKRTAKQIPVDGVRQIKVGAVQPITLVSSVSPVLESNPPDIHPEVYEDHTALQVAANQVQVSTKVVSAPPMKVTLKEGVATVTVPTPKKKGVWDSLGL